MGGMRRWIEKFPPMPTKRYCVSTLCTGTTLIAVGGWGLGGHGYNLKDEVLKTVEVLNTETRVWHTAADLPQLSESSLALCGDLVYLLGGVDKGSDAVNSVYSTSLLSSTGSTLLGGHLVSTLTRSSTAKAAHGTELLTSL